MSKKTFSTLEEALAFIAEQDKVVADQKNQISTLTAEKNTLANSLKVVTDEKSDAVLKIETQTNEISTLKTDNKDLSDQLTEANNALTAAFDEVSTISKKLDLQEKHGSEGEIVTVKGKNYLLSGNRFFANGVEMTAEELSKNSQELERMVKIKSGSLIPVEDN